ncbi:MAG: extracellular solute-binding protein, partial [Clostridia bacterium]|nr:extracellular solute-binding protein [Clostridia bacterium]
PTLRMLGFNASFDPNEDINAKEVEKVTGYHVEYSMLPAENAEEKLNVELASGSNYDIIKLTANQYYQLVGRGALMPLDDLLDQYGADLKATVSEESWKTCQYNGKTYALPMRKEYNKDIMDFIIYRKDILDKLGLERPETIAQLYDVLVAVKAAYPDMIPLTGPKSELGSGDSNWVLSPTITSAFGIYNEWQDVDGALVPMIKQPRMKDMLTFMNKLYGEGLIDADWAINTGTIVQEKFSSGNAFAAVSDRNVVMTMTPATKANFPEAEVDYILPLVGENGEQGIRTSDKILYYSCIPATSKNAAHAINFMNAKAKWDNFLYLTLGTEGETFTREANADAPSGYTWLPMMPQFAELRTNSYWYLNTIDEKNYPDMWMARVRKSEAMWEPFQKVALEGVQASKPDPIGFMPPQEAVT